MPPPSCQDSLTVKRRSVRPPRPDRWSHTWPPRTAPPRSGSSRAGWWSATSATTSASPGPSPTRCCWPFAHEGTAAAVEAVYTEAVGAPSVGLEEPLGLRSCFSRRSIRLGSIGLCSTLGLLSPTGASASGCHLSGGFARHGLDLCLGGFGVSHNGVAVSYTHLTLPTI